MTLSDFSDDFVLWDIYCDRLKACSVAAVAASCKLRSMTLFGEGGVDVDVTGAKSTHLSHNVYYE